MSVQEIPPELQAKAIAEINEVPSKIPEYIEHIRNWLKDQKHIEARTDAQWLLHFLRANKYDMEATKECLDRFYTMKTLTRKNYYNRDPFSPEIQALLKAGIALPLPPLKGSTDPMIWLCRTSQLDYKQMQHYPKYAMMLCDICFLEFPNITISGAKMIMDLADGDDRVFTENIVAWQKMYHNYCTCYMGDQKGIYYINAQPSFSKVIKVLGNLPFLPKAVNYKDMVYSENEYHKLGEELNVLNLPSDYEGNNLSIKELTDYWKTKVESYRDWFLEDEKYGTNEGNRVKKSPTPEEFYGDLVTGIV